MKKIIRDKQIEPFIKEIFLLQDSGTEHRLPFYADGYPGIVYAETEKGVLLLPHNKLLSNFFLYGQTIEPIVLKIKGSYKLIVFQLYPFATRLLLEIDPKSINDDCFDLCRLKNVNTGETLTSLKSSETEKQIEIITNFIIELVKSSSSNPDNTIKFVVSTIINSKGTIPIRKLREQFFITERTFERRFAKEIGVTAKQFSKIIQFSFSLNQLKESDYTTLTNIAYDNGFADQSHFIRSFKTHTGQTPKEMLSKIN
jgi:AraC-like DNA-binding protein